METSGKNTSATSLLGLQFHDKDQQQIKKPDEILINENNSPPSINNDALSNRIQGSMFGMAIGDALGAHVEFRPRSYLEANPVKDLEGGGTWGLDKGQFTDDTSMALCLANSLIACQEFVPYDQLMRYKWWYRNGYMSSTGHCFDIGAATRQSIQEFESRQKKFAQEHKLSLNEMDYSSNPDLFDQFDVNCSKEGVAGNGALMRLAPVPLFFRGDPKKAVEYSGISGKITHGDKKASDACRYYGALIVAALHGATKDDLTSNAFYNDNKPWFGDDTLHPDIMSIAQGSYKKKGGYTEGIRGKGYVVNALEAALWAFWNDENSFEKGVLDAVNLGDDTDTTAAIYGQLAGAHYGYNELPEKWREHIYAKNFVLCVSGWIAYEGESWFKKQAGSDVSGPLINSNPTTETSKTTIIFSQGSSSSNNKRFSTTASIGHNATAVIDRKAIDPSGRIGSLYDIRRDSLVKLSCINFDFNESPPCPQVECIVERGDRIECQNLLSFIGFNNDLRLSLALNIASPTGIASVHEYPYLIDEFTRILYYSYTTRQEYSPTNLDKIGKTLEQLIPKTDATHIITAIDIGIDLIVILRLTTNDSKVNDEALEKMKQSLIHDTRLSDEILLDGILSTQIYSNISHLTKQKTLTELSNTICQMKKNFADYQPINYILHSIERFLPDKNTNFVTFIPLKPVIIQEIEQYLFRFSWINKMWSTTLDNDKSNTFHSYLEEQLREVRKQLSELNEQYKNEKKRLQQLIVNIRYGKDSQQSLEHHILNEKIQSTLKDSIDELIYSITSLKEKGYFIDDLKRRGFDYQTAKKYGIQQNDNENTIQQKLMENNSHLRILCSNDLLNNSNFSRLEDLCSTLLNEKKLNPHLHLIYVDFTYSSYDLNQIKVFPLVNRTTDSNERTSLLLTKTERSNHSSSIDDKTINILLLGKSGVGKSTLINTFKSCLKSSRYEDVISSVSSSPAVISIIGFIKMGFEAHIIRPGVSDPNEDYDHPDQSTTQQCKFYNFNLNNNEKICIIDTPGFGKTHGQNDDDITMQHILSRIMNLTHLNVICVLIQSDENQLDDYQTCLTKLFHFLGDNAINNIVFCFTKVLSKDINSAQRNDLIKVMLETLPTANIPFNEETTFDFDSSYFIDSTMLRYFASFINPSNRTSEQSWTVSKNGWDRLLNYTRENLRPYSIQQTLQKIQLARLKINQLIRPILETVRNNIRNFVLSKTGYSSDSIVLHPTALPYPSAICYSCKRHRYKCGEFWVMSDSPHKYRNTCHMCSCAPEHHLRIEYRLECNYCTNQTHYQSRPTSISREDLLYISAHLAYFLMQDDHMTNNDPYLLYLNGMINEERALCENIGSHSMNLALYNHLINFKHDYQEQIKVIKQNPTQNNLDIDDLIEKVRDLSLIKIQLDVTRKIQEISV